MFLCFCGSNLLSHVPLGDEADAFLAMIGRWNEGAPSPRYFSAMPIFRISVPAHCDHPTFRPSKRSAPESTSASLGSLLSSSSEGSSSSKRACGSSIEATGGPSLLGDGDDVVVLREVIRNARELLYWLYFL